jgi:hypothetical protein
VFVGHFGAGMAGKTVAPRLSLGTLLLSAQWADLVWPILLLAGVERVVIVPGLMKTSALDFVSYPVSHSLLALVGWALLLGGVHFLRRRDARAAAVVGALVVSHWFLDVLMHRPDMPVWPGGPRIGLGLWDSVAGTVAAEIALYGAGVALYLRLTRARDRTGVIALWAFLVVLLALWIGALFGPPPPDARTIAWSGLLGWLFLPWAYWIERHRITSLPPASPRV